MLINLAHKDFDMDMEIALFIPPEPGFVALKSIAKDLGLESTASVVESIGRLRANKEFKLEPERGVRGRTKVAKSGIKAVTTKPNKRHVSVAKAVWPKFKARCENYFYKVNKQRA